jgi:hypothetical protein
MPMTSCRCSDAEVKTIIHRMILGRPVQQLGSFRKMPTTQSVDKFIVEIRRRR